MGLQGGGKGGAEKRVVYRFGELCGDKHCPWSHGDKRLSVELGAEARQDFSQVSCPGSHPCTTPSFRPLPSLTLH